MSNKSKTTYPLFWPPGKSKSGFQRTHNKFKASFTEARDNCVAEIKRLGGSEVIVSSNVPLNRRGKAQGVPWGKAIAGYSGVAVYFKRKGKELCFACDCWSHVQDNMNAITHTIEALRGIARWGTGDMMEAAFTGFMALPAPGQTTGESPWQILSVAVNATEEQILDAYRAKAKIHHPDRGGNPADFHRIQQAYNLLAQNLKTKS